MIRTEIYLTEEQKQSLITLAHAESIKTKKRVSMADIIRNAINSYLKTRNDFPLLNEAALLGQSAALKRIVNKSLKQIKAGKTRPVREFLDELPD
ncbi:MAG: hypothetical protein A2161_01545 [Candidatus Schekmanbacteria bacterium RBG_13_48_7]|uniref:Uncharacterized protein n=1 Tax=Candidatus Schekmanbacteria bacterium RBG_13_48_7 TaxID=1817878 RepID=A0A1F7RWA1_9BACT|nr:MAG: hypothetical protein A2161_01545 [Candidatus Schekmanbacteria bacterium RBG_13_48_7]